MAYLFYFLGFISFYRISEHLAENDEPEWYHLIVGLIWPVISILALLRDLKLAIFGEESE